MSKGNKSNGSADRSKGSKDKLECEESDLRHKRSRESSNGESSSELDKRPNKITTIHNFSNLPSRADVGGIGEVGSVSPLPPGPLHRINMLISFLIMLTVDLKEFRSNLIIDTM